jgi:hypothetical protein
VVEGEADVVGAGVSTTATSGWVPVATSAALLDTVAAVSREPDVVHPETIAITRKAPRRMEV